MKNVYLGVGAVAIFAAGFIAGSYYDKFRWATSTVGGIVVSRDDSSITLRMADNSVRAVPLLDTALVIGQPEAVPAEIMPGQQVMITLSNGAAATVIVDLPAPDFVE